MPYHDIHVLNINIIKSLKIHKNLIIEVYVSFIKCIHEVAIIMVLYSLLNIF